MLRFVRMKLFVTQRFLAIVDAPEELPELPKPPRPHRRALLHSLAERMTPEARAELGTFAEPGVDDDTH